MNRSSKIRYAIAGVMMALALCFAVNADAQFRYGLRLGGEINTSRLTGVTEFGLKHGSGFSGGLTCEYMFERSGLAVGASVMYTHGAASLCGPDDAQPALKLGNDFLQVPVHLKYKYFLPGVSNLAGPFVYTGPALMVRLDSDADGVPFGTRRLQPGWDVGIGFDVINFLQISAGYRFGLGNAFHPADMPQGAPKLRNDAVNISVALLFDV